MSSGEDSQPISKKEVMQALNEAMNQRRSIDEATHFEDHAFVRSLIRRQKRRREMFDAVRKQVIGWGVVLFLTGIGMAVYHEVVNLVKRGG